MSFFKKRHDATLGVVIDIGSASVLVALVESTEDAPAPAILWSHREHVPLRGEASLEQCAKNVMTALMSAALLIDSDGRKVLEVARPRAPKPTVLSVSVAAPWSYTVTKTIRYNEDGAFRLTPSLVAELERTAEENTSHDLKENEVASSLGLTIVARTTLALTGNGYPVPSAHGQEVVSATLSRTSAILQKYLVTALQDIHEKIMPRAVMRRYSFMLAYYAVVRKLFPALSEYCLIDITYEATEIGIVRDGVLVYSTHTPYGAFSLARDVAGASDLPLGEAYGRLSARDFLVADESKASAVSDVYTAYEKRLTDLFHETGDALSIPKTLILHGNLDTESFFAERVKAAAEAATKSHHTVIPISASLAEQLYDEAGRSELRTRHDTAMLISAQFFHTHRNDPQYDWEQ